MATITRADFDKLVSHTIRIELKDGFVLIYYVNVEAKTAFYKFLKEDAISDYENEFVWFYITHDRLVLVNKKDIVRITFCFDPPDGTELQYHDNFNILDKSEEIREVDEESEESEEKVESVGAEKLYLPQLIIMHHRQMEDTEFLAGVTMKTEGYFGNISSYSSLGEGDVEGFDFEYIDDEEEWVLLTYKYLQFIDDDGEENFMPLENLSAIEIERPLLMSDELLHFYLDRKSRKQHRTKK